MLLLLAIYWVIGTIFATIFGTATKMGGVWAFFISIFFSPVVAIIAAAAFGKRKDDTYVIIKDNGVEKAVKVR